MSIKKQKLVKALPYLEKLLGGPLTLAGLIEAIRIGDEISQVDFAKTLGISKSHLCDIEKGRKAVSLARAIEFAEKLGYSKDQFARLALQALVDEAGLKYEVSLRSA